MEGLDESTELWRPPYFCHSSQFIISATGDVAFIVGGNGLTSVEVYSPEGKCQHRLSDIPIEGDSFMLPVLAYIDGKILSCAGNTMVALGEVSDTLNTDTSLSNSPP